MAEFLDVPVAGGALRVARWGDAGPTVVAAHGITSSHVAWTLVGEQLDGEVRLLAPDLRGRGESAGLPGPWGMGAHADDLIAVLDRAGVDRALLVGHSMGAFVTAVTAVRHPDRVSGLIMIDGGLPLTGELPPDADVDAVLHAIIGPSLERLQRTFASRDEYRAFWRGHPAFAGGDIPGSLADAYADYDLAGAAPELRSKVSPEAVRADAADTLVSDDVRTAIDRLDCDALLLWAQRGMLDEERGLYAQEMIEEGCARNPRLRAQLVANTNHFSITLGETGSRVVAAAILDAA